MTQLYFCSPQDIIVPEDRQRKSFKKDKMEQLKASLLESGQIQPGVCYLNEDGKPVLVAGERRLRACLDIQKDFCYHLKEAVDEFELKKIELEENLCREDLTWQEEVSAKEELHALYQNLRPSHTLTRTAAILQVSKGNLSEDIELSIFAKSVPEAAQAKTKSEAKKILKKIKEMVSHGEALKDLKREAEKKQSAAQGFSLGLDGKKGGKVSSEVAKGFLEAGANRGKIQSLSPKEAHFLECNNRSLLGTLEDNFEELRSRGPFDIIFFDPPWGVNFDTVYDLRAGSTAYADDRKKVFKQLGQWLDLIKELSNENSHLFMFFGIVNYSIIISHLNRRGWSPNRIPLIWHKQGSHRTRQPTAEFGRSYEPIIFARLGTKPIISQGHPNILTTPQPTPKMKSIHPSAKHPQIYLDLLKAVAKPGDKVLDPMSGSGMLAVACDKLLPTHHLDWTINEMSEPFRNVGLRNLWLGYDEIVGDQTEPEEPTKPDFTTMLPGTKQWIDHWKKFPEDQEAMLEFAKTK